jgi:hypothetical protein
MAHGAVAVDLGRRNESMIGDKYQADNKDVTEIVEIPNHRPLLD